MALWTLMIVIVWREVGFGIVLFLARLLSLPEEQLEAARIDGAGWWSRLRYVILPELRGTIEFYCVIAAITMLAWVFGYVWTLTKGGPGDATTVLELYIYNQGLRNSLPGHGFGRRGAADGRDDDLRRAPLLRPPPAARGGGRVDGRRRAARPDRVGARASRRAGGRPSPAASSASSCSSAPRSSRSTRCGSWSRQRSSRTTSTSRTRTGSRGRSTLANFSDALRGGEFFRWLANSAILSFGSVLIATAFGALAAFAIARMRFRGRDAFLSINVALLIVPPVVMLIPLFTLYTQFSMVSTYWGVIILYAGLTLPFSVYLLSNFFRAIPRELFESAAMDGASHFTILRRILLPLSAPALVTLVVVNALWVWNELLIALVFLPDEEQADADGRRDGLPGALHPRRPADHGGHVPGLDTDVPPLPVRPAALHPRAHCRRRQGLVMTAVCLV